MNSEWRNSQIDKIQNGTSVFGFVPKEIGRIIYCDTTLPVNDGTSNNNKAKYNLLFAFIVVILLWIFLYKIYVIPIIATGLFACFATSFLSLDKGTDFLLGEKGFAVIKYKNRRDKIIDTNIIMFDDVSQFFLGENKIFKKTTFSEEYDRTEYFFSLYKKSNTKDDVSFTLLYSDVGSYIVGDENDPEDLWIFPEYTFFKEVEKVWYRIYSDRTSNKQSVFYVLKIAMHKNRIKDIISQRFFYRNGRYSNAIKTSDLADIKIEGKIMFIGDTEYDLSCLKYLYLENGVLIIENENNIDAIQIWGLGNAKAFLSILKSVMNQDV